MSKTNLFSRTIDQFADLLDLFFTDGYIDVYRQIFSPEQYPFWTTIQATWVLYVLKRSYRLTSPSVLRYLKQFFLGAVMTFAGREIAAIRLKEVSPLYEHSLSGLIYIVLFLFFEFSPFDFFYSITNRFFYFIGLLQGTNQAKFFVIISQKIPVSQAPVAILCALLDQITERGWRSVLGGRETPMSTLNTIAKNLLFFAFFIGVTNEGRLSSYIGTYDVEVPALFLAAMMGIFNAFDNFGLKYDDIDPEEVEKIRKENSEKENEIKNKEKEEEEKKIKDFKRKEEKNKGKNKVKDSNKKIDPKNTQLSRKKKAKK